MDLLTKSGCSRYVEFKAVNKICIYQSGVVEQVHYYSEIHAAMHSILFRFHVHEQMYLKAN